MPTADRIMVLVCTITTDAWHGAGSHDACYNKAPCHGVNMIEGAL